MTTIVTDPVTLGAGVPDATTIESDLKFLIIQSIASTLTFQEAPLALVKSSILSGALLAANNLSDLADAAIARGNLGAKNLFYVPGTSAPSNSVGIVNDFAFNDSLTIYEKTDSTTWSSRTNGLTQSAGDARYTRRANNLSDLVDAVAARGNLGLGTAAVLNAPSTGNATSTQVVKGNDSRLPAVSISGTPTAGQVPVAINSTTAAWQTPSSGGGGASGIPYLYNENDPPSSAGEIRTPQASLNVATSISIDDTDVNSDSTIDITARLKTGTIFTIAKDAANFVRCEATANYASGSVAVTVRAEQGTIANGDTIYLAIASDAPSAGGSIEFTESTASSLNASANTGIISNTTSRQTIVLPIGTSPEVVAVQGKGSGGWQIDGNGALIYLPDGSNDTGLRNLTGHRYSAVQLLRLDSGSWAVNQSNDISGLELFTLSGYDVSSVALFNAVTAAGGSLTTPQKDAIDSLIVAMKTGDKWSKTQGLYLFVGATAATQAINAKSPGTNNLTFAGTGTHNGSGYTTNGVDTYANTGILPPSSRRGLISFSFSSFGGVNAGAIVGALSIAGDVAFFVSRLFDRLYSSIDVALGRPFQSITGASSGSLAACRQSDTEYKTYVNGSVSETISATVSTNTQDGPICIGAISSGVSASSATFSMVTLGANYTDPEVAELAALEAAYLSAR